MKSRLVLFSVACVLLMAENAPAAVISAAYSGSGATYSYNPGAVYVHPQAGSVAVAASPPVAQPMMVQVPAANVQVQTVMQVPVQSSGQQIALIPVNSVPTSYSFGDKLYNVFYGLSNSIATKARGVGEFLRILCGGRPQYVRPQYVIVNVPTTESTTTTKKCNKITKSTTSTTTESTTSTTTESNESCEDCEEDEE